MRVKAPAPPAEWCLVRWVQACRRRIATIRAHPERGIAVPMVMTMIVIGFALASVGSVAAISSIRNAGRDNDDKSAFGVAEAGAEQALYRQNKILTTPLTSRLGA